MTLRDDPAGLAPERVIVFEVAGSIADFAAACARVPGLECLVEREFEFEPDEDFWVVDTRRGRERQPRDDKHVGGRVYAAMPDLRALRDLLSLWRRYQDQTAAGRGRKVWFDLFERLRDLRPWGPEDRISEDALTDFRMDLEQAPGSTATVEVELWHRDSSRQRDRASRELARIVAQAGGSVLHRASIPPIAYDAALVRLPREEVARVLRREPVHLVVCDDIMFVRPQCPPVVRPTGQQATVEKTPPGPLPSRLEPSVAALLDGVPVQKHRLLDGRIVIDDPDGLDGRSMVSGRHHGTAMASLILHGELGRPDVPLSRLLHLQPVLYAPDDGSDERFLPHRLLVDTIYRAVTRMKTGNDGTGPTAPRVFLVNLSLGDQRRPYAGWISPWARLLDHLAHEYGILFVVSAGNITAPLPIPRFDTVTAFEDADASSREDAVLDGLGRQRSQRTLLSPSEAMNVVTVGASHDEWDTGAPGPNGAGSLLDPYDTPSLPNVSSAMGLGHRKVIKPEILMPGGKEHVRPLPDANGCSIWRGQEGPQFGIAVASPDTQGRLDREKMASGTSVAAALATRAAHQLFDALMDPDNGGVLADADPAYRAVVVRALLVHSARWDETVAIKLGDLYGPHGRGKHVARLDNVARVIGYGVPRVSEATSCSAHRATLVGYGDIGGRELASCRLPLPQSLIGVTVPRTVTVTLAWFTPVNVRNLAYRMAKLEVKEDLKTSFKTPRTSHQPSHSSIPRGTLFHQRYHGEKAVQFIEDEELVLRIACKEPAGRLDERIRYGLAVTIEAGEGVPVYQEIRDRLAVRPRG